MTGRPHTPPANVHEAISQPASFAVNKQAVEQELRALRDRSRLAIHVCEEDIVYSFNAATYALLGKVGACDLLDKLKINRMPLLSMSLLPTMSVGQSIAPYGGLPDTLVNYAYLVDLDQSQAHAPRVVYAAGENLRSGDDPYLKSYWAKEKNEPFASIYAGFQNQEKWEKAITGPEGKNLGNAMLDALAAAFFRSRIPGHFPKDINPHNEVIVAATKEHVKAIAIPYFEKPGNGREYKPWMRPMAELTAAVSGLQHLQKGIELPVVLYQVGRPFLLEWNPQQNELTYVGKGREELLAVAAHAMEALEKLRPEQKSGPEAVFAIGTLKRVVKKLLGVDMDSPLAQQRICFTMAAVEK